MDDSTAQHLIYLNQIAQGLHTVDDALSALRTANRDGLAEAVRTLQMLCIQAGARQDDVTEALIEAGTPEEWVPPWLPSSGSIPTPYEVAELHDPDLSDTFRYLLHLFRIADKRRRSDCAGQCYHWWHQDLADERVVADVRSFLAKL